MEVERDEVAAGPVLEGVATTTEEDWQVRRLQDRRAMETEQELQRIRVMGRVRFTVQSSEF